MQAMVLYELESLLKAGNVSKSLTVMRNWLNQAEPGEPEKMLSAAMDSMRPRLALLMRDLLSRYPTTLVGVPMLIYAMPDFEGPGVCGAKMSLPFPDPEHAQPCEDLHFLGWLPCTTPLPLALPFHPERHATQVPWSQPTSLIALFRGSPDIFDLDQVELPNSWWGYLFRSAAANIHLSARMVLPYPDALEAARTMHSYLHGKVPRKGQFLSDAAWTLSCDEAALFKESCRHAFRSAFD